MYFCFIFFINQNLKNLYHVCSVMSCYTYEGLENRITRIDWDTYLDSNSVEEGWNKFIQILNVFRDNHIPKFTRNVNKVLPWFSNRIWKLIKKKKNLFKRYRKTGLFYFKAKYNQARNLVTKQIRVAKAKYESKIIKRSRKNRKVFYSYIATKNRKEGCKKVGPIVKLRNDGREKEFITQDVEVASHLNEYFISVFNRKDKSETYVKDFERSSQIERIRFGLEVLS